MNKLSPLKNWLHVIIRNVHGKISMILRKSCKIRLQPPQVSFVRFKQSFSCCMKECCRNHLLLKKYMNECFCLNQRNFGKFASKELFATSNKGINGPLLALVSALTTWWGNIRSRQICWARTAQKEFQVLLLLLPIHQWTTFRWNNNCLDWILRNECSFQRFMNWIRAGSSWKTA